MIISLPLSQIFKAKWMVYSYMFRINFLKRGNMAIAFLYSCHGYCFFTLTIANGTNHDNAIFSTLEFLSQSDSAPQSLLVELPCRLVTMHLSIYPL